MRSGMSRSKLGLGLLLAVYLLSASVFATTTCQTMVGSWEAPGYPMTVTQDGSGNLAVTMTETPCGDGIGPCTYTGTGTLNLSSGNFSFSVATTEDTLVDYYDTLLVYPLSMSYSGTMEAGCNDAQTSNITYNYSSSCVGWFESYGYSASDAAPLCATPYVDDSAYDITEPCDMPSGTPAETTVQVGPWDSGSGAPWNQTLQPTTFNFGGRYVTEESPGDGTDSCWFSLSIYDPFVHVSGGTWNVDASSVWGSDYVGYSEDMVHYYRTNGVVPCGARFQQEMYIGCSDSPPSRTYITNDLGSDITSTSVSSIRAGSTAYNTSW
jgi:hypothetical protein